MSEKYKDDSYIITDDGRLLVSTATLTQKLKTTKQSLSVWVKKGCPREKPGWYDLFAVIEWRNTTNAGETVTDADKLRADVRLKEARLELANIEIQIKNAELVPMSLVKEYLQGAFTDLKNNMLTIGDRVMTDVYSQYPELAQQARRTIDGCIRSALKELANSKTKLKPAESSKPKKATGRPRKSSK